MIFNYKRLSILICTSILSTHLLCDDNTTTHNPFAKIGAGTTVRSAFTNEQKRQKELGTRRKSTGELDYEIAMGHYQQSISRHSDDIQKCLWTAMYTRSVLQRTFSHPHTNATVKQKITTTLEELDTAIATFPREERPSWIATHLQHKCLPCQEFVNRMQEFMNTRGVDVKEKAKEYSCGAFALELNDQLRDIIYNPTKYMQD